MNSALSRISPLIAFALAIILIFAAGLLLDGDYFRFALNKGKHGAEEEERVKHTVRYFNSVLTDISDSMGKTSSDDVPATKLMRHKLYMDTGVNAMSRRTLVYDLASLEISRVEWPAPRAAIVLTREAWNYQYRDARDRGELDIIKGMDDEFRYVLIKQDGTWLVHRSTAVLKDMKRDK